MYQLYPQYNQASVLADKINMILEYLHTIDRRQKVAPTQYVLGIEGASFYVESVIPGIALGASSEFEADIWLKVWSCNRTDQISAQMMHVTLERADAIYEDLKLVAAL